MYIKQIKNLFPTQTRKKNKCNGFQELMSQQQSNKGSMGNEWKHKLIIFFDIETYFTMRVSDGTTCHSTLLLNTIQ